MKLIIIHGPPAAGKYTVGSVLQNLIGFRLFHNHLSIDCVKPVLDFGTDAFWRLNVKIRCEVIAEAAREDVSITHTFCYGKGVDDHHFAEIIAAAESNGGQVHIVLLKCSDDERRRRIADDSRARLGKLTDAAAVPAHGVDLTSTYEGRATLVVDNISLSPIEAAERIIEHFGLARLEVET